MSLPTIRGTQVGLRNPEVVDAVKKDMLAGIFHFAEPRAQIAGVIDAAGTYHIFVGHHRVVAALEIFRESGDDGPIVALLRYGKWDRVEEPPRDSRPISSRAWWGALRNWLGY